MVFKVGVLYDAYHHDDSANPVPRYIPLNDNSNKGTLVPGFLVPGAQEPTQSHFYSQEFL